MKFLRSRAWYSGLYHLGILIFHDLPTSRWGGRETGNLNDIEWCEDVCSAFCRCLCFVCHFVAKWLPLRSQACCIIWKLRQLSSSTSDATQMACKCHCKQMTPQAHHVGIWCFNRHPCKETTPRNKNAFEPSETRGCTRIHKVPFLMDLNSFCSYKHVLAFCSGKSVTRQNRPIQTHFLHPRFCFQHFRRSADGMYKGPFPTFPQHKTAPKINKVHFFCRT